MSKRLNKVLMAVLAAVVALCMVIATAGLTTARADVTTGNITMLDSAQVRQTGEMGIRFSATISATDYEALKAQGAEFGMIIAPADWVESDDDLAFGSSKLSLYDGTQGATDKFFAKGTNTPVQDITDFNGNNDTSDYILTCSFIKIKESNFDRNFKARAYYKIGNDYFHSDNVIDRNIYTVASNALVNGDVEDEVVTDYLAGIVGKVADEDSTLNVTVNGDVANKGDKFTVKAATINTGKKVVDTAVALSVERDGETVVDGLTYANGEYTVNTAGYLTLVAKVGDKTIDVKELTAKRTDVKVTLVPGKAGDKYYDFVALDDTSKIDYIDLQQGDNKVSAMGYSVIVKAEIDDPENPEAKATIDDYKLDCNTDWISLDKYSDFVYVAHANRNKKIAANATVSVSYTDAYGFEYTASLPIYGRADESVYFGKSEDFTATDALMVTLNANQWLTIEDVDLTKSTTSDLITFGLVNPGMSTGVKTRSWAIRVSEADNPTNYVDFLGGLYVDSHYCTAMYVPTWTLEKGVAGYADRVTGANADIFTFNKYKHYPENGYMGNNFNDYGIIKAFQSKNIYNHDSINYKLEMVGISIINSEIFINAGWSDKTWKNRPCLLTKERQTENGLTAWNGFDNVTKVDISIMPTYGGGATMIIDQLAGSKVTAAWLDNMYYSYRTYADGPNLFNDAANA